LVYIHRKVHDHNLQTQSTMQSGLYTLSVVHTDHIPKSPAGGVVRAVVLVIDAEPLCDPVLHTGTVIHTCLKPIVTKLTADRKVGQGTWEGIESPVGHMWGAAMCVCVWCIVEGGVFRLAHWYSFCL